MPTPTTRAGYDKIKSELDRLEQVEMPKITKALAEARAEGDLKENAEYHAQRENQGMCQAKIDLLKTKLADAYIVDAAATTERIAFGLQVTLKDLDDDSEEIYQIVGPGEEDYSGEVMKILSTSPLAQQIADHKVGDQIDVQTPGGTVNYEVLSIEFAE